MKFVDLHLIPRAGGRGNMEEMLSHAAALGFSAVGVVFPSGARDEELRAARRCGDEAGVDVLTRIDLLEREASSKALQRASRVFDIVSVECHSDRIARKMLTNNRADVIVFPSETRGSIPIPKKFKGRARASIEVNLIDVLLSKGLVRAKLLKRTKHVLDAAMKYSIDIITSSGASEKRFMRSPMDMISILSLVQVDGGWALSTISETPIALMDRKRVKRDGDRHGITVVRR